MKHRAVQFPLLAPKSWFVIVSIFINSLWFIYVYIYGKYKAVVCDHTDSVFQYYVLFWHDNRLKTMKGIRKIILGCRTWSRFPTMVKNFWCSFSTPLVPTYNFITPPLPFLPFRDGKRIKFWVSSDLEAGKPYLRSHITGALENLPWAHSGGMLVFFSGNTGNSIRIEEYTGVWSKS